MAHPAMVKNQTDKVEQWRRQASVSQQICFNHTESHFFFVFRSVPLSYFSIHFLVTIKLTMTSTTAL